MQPPKIGKEWRGKARSRVVEVMERREKRKEDSNEIIRVQRREVMGEENR